MRNVRDTGARARALGGVGAGSHRPSIEPDDQPLSAERAGFVTERNARALLALARSRRPEAPSTPAVGLHLISNQVQVVVGSSSVRRRPVRFQPVFKSQHWGGQTGGSGVALHARSTSMGSRFA